MVANSLHYKGLSPCNGGGGDPRTSIGQRRKLSHQAEEIRTRKSIDDTQQSLVLRLSLRKFGGHGSRVSRNQIALCHLQLALLSLRVRTRRLQSAQLAIKRTPLGRQLPQSCGQRTCIC